MTKTTAASSKHAVTGTQMQEAERTLKVMLRHKFPGRWIVEHAQDVLGQAHVEYLEWTESNGPARSPVGWLCTCAYRRALNIRDSERRRPHLDPLDTVFHLPDEKTPTPEQEAIEHDRQERLRAAMSHLPAREIKLLSLVYYEDNSIREAGRKLGWQKSAADRHHDKAMKKLRALVGDDRSLFSPATLGLAAYLASRGGRLSHLLDAVLTPARELVAIGAEAASVGSRRVADLARSLSPFSDAGSAAANSGIGRAAGACGAGIVALVCVGAATVVAPGLNSAPSPHRPEHSRQVKGPAQPSSPSAVTPAATTTELPTPELPTPAHAQHTQPSQAKATKQPQVERKQAQAAHAPQATPKQTESEFGVDRGSSSTPEAAPAPAPEAAPESSASAPSSSSPPETSKPSGSSATQEFGL